MFSAAIPLGSFPLVLLELLFACRRRVRFLVSRASGLVAASCHRLPHTRRTSDLGQERLEVGEEALGS